MKKYTIVTTYPAKGSKNIGDKLIQESTKKAIRRVKGSAEFRTVWREEDWDTVRSHVESSDAVVFACLAIRDQMKQVYPYLSEIVKSGVPFGVLASGTLLRPGNIKESLYDFSKEDSNLLRKVSERALFWGTRGILTQKFCKKHRVEKAKFTGDIAFVDENFEDRKFESNQDIKQIAVTDPHYAPAYKKVFLMLIEKLKDIFQKSKVSVFVHGKNPSIENICEKKSISYKRLYNKENGLDEYEDIDLHVGFRLHGHVSALSRRIYSYSLEQDGRGAEYGLSIERKISVPCYRYKLGAPESRKNGLRLALGRSLPNPTHVPENAIEQIMTLINQDKKDGFSRFVGLETQIKRFQSNNLSLIKQLP